MKIIKVTKASAAKSLAHVWVDEVTTRSDPYMLRLEVDGQSFQIGNSSQRQEHAEFLRDMLVKALEKAGCNVMITKPDYKARPL